MRAYISLRACECTAAAIFIFLRREHCGRPLYENGGKGGAGAHASANLQSHAAPSANNHTHLARRVGRDVPPRTEELTLLVFRRNLCLGKLGAHLLELANALDVGRMPGVVIIIGEYKTSTRQRAAQPRGWVGCRDRVAACSPTRWRGAGVRRGNEKRAAGPETPWTPRTQPRGGGNQGSGEGNQRAQAGLMPGTMPKR